MAAALLLGSGGELKTLVLTANNRPDYLEQVQLSLYECEGIDEYQVAWSVEPGNPEVLELCRTFDAGARNIVWENPKCRGALGNPWTALEWGFNNTRRRFVILGEDDSLFAPDALRWFEFASTEYWGRKSVFAVCANQLKDVGTSLRGHRLENHFSPTIWGTWRDRWYGFMRDEWDFDYSHNGWDWNFARLYLPTMQCVFPVVSRASHIGRQGTHIEPSGFDKSVPVRFAGKSALRRGFGHAGRGDGG